MLASRTSVLPASIRARSSESATRSVSVVGGLLDQPDLKLLLRGELAVHPAEQDPGHVEDRVERSAQLVGDAGEKRGLELRGPRQLGRRGRPARRRAPARPRLVSASSALSRSASAWCSASVASARTSSWLLVFQLVPPSPSGRAAGERPAQLGDRDGVAARRAAGSSLPSVDRGALPGRALDGEPVGQAPGAHQADAQTGGRLVLSRRAPGRGAECRDRGPRYGRPASSSPSVSSSNWAQPPPRILDRVPRDLGDRRGERA